MSVCSVPHEGTGPGRVGRAVARLNATRFRGGRRARSARTGGGTATQDRMRPPDRRRTRDERPDRGPGGARPRAAGFESRHSPRKGGDGQFG